MVMLRCKYCGAPLDKKELESTSAYITCSSCGTSQQRMDAKAYLDQMMGQIQNWISKAIPGGFSMSQTENVDSIARYNIFNNNIRPRIETEYTEYKFAVNSLLSNALMVLPFSTDNSAIPSHTSTRAFEFNAKVKSVEALAVDEASKTLITSAEEIASAYALLINNTKLMKEDKPGRYILMGNNFNETAQAFKKIKNYRLAGERFEALAKMCEGCEKLLNGDIMGSTSYFESSGEMLKAIGDKVSMDFDLGIMYQAVSTEIKQAMILKDISLVVLNNNREEPLKILDMVGRIISLQLPKTGKWGYALGNNDRLGDIFGHLSAALAAKNGGTIPIAQGPGEYLIPFWDIDLRYSFQTGSAWSKKSVEVVEDLLVPADFVIDSMCLSNPSSALTDIFLIRPEKSILSGITGKETSISGGEGIGRLSDTAAMNSPGSRKIVVPLSTKREAEKIVVEYLASRTQSDSKLKLSKPYVKNLIYIPCDIKGGTVVAPQDFGKLVPERIRRTNISQLIIV